MSVLTKGARLQTVDDETIEVVGELGEGGQGIVYKVLLNGSYTKPSRAVKPGDTIEVKRLPVVYTYRVVELVSSRQPAKNVPAYCLNITPQSELDKLTAPRETIFVFRDRGTGRPTKPERRDLDSLMDGIFLDDDEDDDED